MGKAADMAPSAKAGRDFTTTQWGVVLLAAGHSSQSGAALEELCGAYWFPLYAFVRRKGYGREEAEDLVQGFFARLVEKNFLAQADRAKGKFRTFLLAALTHFLANEWNRQQTLRRGGGYPRIRCDLPTAEARYLREPFEDTSPERLFDRRWATVLLERTYGALRQEYCAAGKGSLFDSLQPWLTGESTTDTYRDLAPRLNLSPGAVKVAVHRLRRAFGERLRQEVALTVTSPEQVQEEMQHLFAILRE